MAGPSMKMETDTNLTMRKIRKLLLGAVIVAAIVFAAGLLIPYSFRNPVDGATCNDYNQESYWYYPWGTSVTHKGVDIFKAKGTPVRPAAGVEFVLFAGHRGGKGGNIAITLAPKWRMHYYAHMDEVRTRRFAIVTHDSVIGTVGNTGNAVNTPAHLHFSIMSLLPHPWDIDDSPHGKWKALYMNPVNYLNEYHSRNNQID